MKSHHHHVMENFEKTKKKVENMKFPIVIELTSSIPPHSIAVNRQNLISAQISGICGGKGSVL